MGKIIQIEDMKPHLSGTTRCAACYHEWVGVIPIDQDGNPPVMECPECGLMQGFYLHPICVDVGKEIYRCRCSGEFFVITRNGALCVRCGLTHDFCSME